MVQLRTQVLKDTMKEMFEYLRDNGQVGILDGSNTSHEIREYITKRIAQEVQFDRSCERSPMSIFHCGSKCE